MGATIHREGALRVVRLSGMLRKAEMDAIHQEMAKDLASEAPARALVIAEGFQGWVKGDAWGDVSFVANYGDRIDRIAVVGEPQWEDRALMFAGAGFRKTQIKYFYTDQIAKAKEWLGE